MRESILIIDDTPVNLKLTRVVLNSEGYNVRTAGDAQEALQILETFRPDLILVDIQLPGMDGLELTRRIRRNPEMANVAIVALTAYAMRGDEQAALRAGCNGYITKPIDTREFPKTVRSYLAPERRPEVRPVSERQHDLPLDALSRRFAADGVRQCQQLLDGLEARFDAAQAGRLLHQWAGLGGALGHPGIGRMARDIERILGGEEAAGLDELRQALTQLREAFAAALPARRPEEDVAAERSDRSAVV